MSELDYLLDMGFSKSLAEQALRNTGNRGLEAAMDWLVEHQGDTEPPETEKSDDFKVPPETPALEAKSFKCEECSKSLRNGEEVQLHSARTGHVNFSESSDEVKQLTEEERKAQMDKLQDLLRLKKEQRELQEQQEELEREKRRRQQGKNISSAKEKFEEDQIRRAIEQQKRERAEDKAYREKLKADIAREREEKKRSRQNEPIQKETVARPAILAQSDAPVCRLQIRLPTGSPLKCEFNPSEPLSAVILYISQHWPDCPDGVDPTSISVMTTFPKRRYTVDELQVPLRELDLCPSAVLTALKQ